MGYRRRPAWQQERRDRFAEIMAEGSTVTGAGRVLGMSQSSANSLWQSIKKEMGEQAR